jgi:hypothetical protein
MYGYMYVHIMIMQFDAVSQTRLQAGGDYRGGLDAFRTILRNEGAKGLYKGLPANLVGIIRRAQYASMRSLRGMKRLNYIAIQLRRLSSWP